MHKSGCKNFLNYEAYESIHALALAHLENLEETLHYRRNFCKEFHLDHQLLVTFLD